MNPLLAKILWIVLLSLVLLLPLWRVESLIAERSALRDSAVEHDDPAGDSQLGRWRQGVLRDQEVARAGQFGRRRGPELARAGFATGALAGLCYSLLYLLMLSEDYTLLFGARALFFLLAVIMLGARKLDWYRVAKQLQ